ncbi:MAG: T9SS type A sorting domain-containing protein [Saprospiraceae bacterium]|nr:T9SS type A sorting domain-containing protein [Saprospiraceae bacterium]
MIRVLLMLLVCFTFTYGQAQNLPAAPKGCGYDHYVHTLEQQYPGFKAQADQLLQDVKKRPQLAKDLEIYRIPVVVHIVYKEESQNIPEDQIKDVIDVLNEDFRRKNADAELIREDFLDVVGDPFIEFELAAVERVETQATFELDLLGGSLPDNVKQTAEGGSDAWDTQKYLNIWVCNIEGGSLLGYAYPPADLAHWPDGANAPSPELDGVVIHQEVFRRTGTHTASGLLGMDEVTIPVRGRTITHEVGHYLGLRHIWGDGLLSILGIPDCDADDGVVDTPQQGVSSQFACDAEQNTCEEGETDKLDMFENFMDYAREDCLNSFTKGQIAIMRSVLENERSGLIDQVSNTIAIVDDQDFHVYPNPAKGQLFIESSLQENTPYQVRLVDTQGRMVKAPALGRPADRQTVNVSGLPAGLYGLVILQGDKQYFQKVVIR